MCRTCERCGSWYIIRRGLLRFTWSLAKHGSVVFSHICAPDRWHRSAYVLGYAALKIGSSWVTAIVNRMTITVALNAADPKMYCYRRHKHNDYDHHNVTAYLRAYALLLIATLTMHLLLPYGGPGTPLPAYRPRGVCALCVRTLPVLNAAVSSVRLVGWVGSYKPQPNYS